LITITQQMHFDWFLGYPCGPCARVSSAHWKNHAHAQGPRAGRASGPCVRLVRT